MGAFTNKTILLLSPQSWGKMFISKHHYAVELARKGNKVFYLNPPGEGHEGKERVAIRPLPDVEGLFLVTHRLYFPYNLKFHAQGLFHWLMRRQVGSILRAIGRQPDIIWSFDLNHMYPLSFFDSGAFKIFHPVDEPLNKTALAAGKGADIVFSVTEEILEKYGHLNVGRHFINHGVAKGFLDSPDGRPEDGRVRVGFSGNLLRKDLDRGVLLDIIRQHPAVEFHFWGSYSISQANIGGGEDKETQDFIRVLQSSANIVLHGAVPSSELARAIHGMDAFLICYDIKKDQSGGTNYHKIMEYLCTGKVVIANNITTYKNKPELVQMVMERDNNRQLPALFSQVIQHLDEYNSQALQQGRIDFATANTYGRQIERIDELCSKHAALNKSL
ncbi:MAG TPA: hypothetical protein VGM31_05875 [Puia sp.]